jgi:hypothetical protein
MQHFLDTSVLRLKFHGTFSYREYLKGKLNTDKLYISPYVQMEFKRSYLCSIIDFYFILKMPNIYTIGDALSLWSDKFKTSELKAILQFVGVLFKSHLLNVSEPKDKNKALDILGSYIIRIEIRLRKSFNDIGSHITHCSRATIPFDKTEGVDKETEIRNFNTGFKDVKECRARCKIDDFFYKRFLAEVEQYKQLSQQLIKPDSKENKGFTKIVHVLESGTQIKSCKVCERIGDAVIALEMPNTMRLETLDQSFEHLCPPINKNHFKHPSQSAFIKSQNLSN